MSLSKRRIAYWVCMAVYLVGVVSYLAGLGAFEPTAKNVNTIDASFEEGTQKVTYIDNPLGPQDDSSFLELFSPVEWAELILGISSMAGAIVLLKELNADEEFLSEV